MLNRPLEVSVSSVARFSSDGRVYRAFGYLLGAGLGELLLVPLGMTTGDLRQVTDACPVPWSEVHDIIDTPRDHPVPMDEVKLYRHFPLLHAIDRACWDCDEMESFTGSGTRVIRLVHATGIRFARLA